MSDKAYSNFLTYAQTCLKSFEELPFNEVDSTIFSWLSYLNLHEDIANNFSSEGMPLNHIIYAEYLPELLQDGFHVEDTLQLMYAVVSNPRYRSTRIKYYRKESSPEITLQFSAMVFSFSETMHYIAYRGTDSMVHAWKEDVMLLMKEAAPCQKLAVNYLNAVAGKLPGDLIVGGHSKGGHNAVYASAFCEPSIQQRILTVYNHDGPGFVAADLQTPGLQRIRSRIRKTIPVGSPVGLILQNETEPKYIESNLNGVLKHLPSSWHVEGYTFSPAPERNTLVKALTANINRWSESVSDTQLQTFIDGLFGMVEMSGISDFSEILMYPVKHLRLIADTLRKTNRADRQFVLSTLFNALSGKTEDGRAADASDMAEFGIDWNLIDQVLNERQTDAFQKEYDLFI